MPNYKDPHRHHYHRMTHTTDSSLPQHTPTISAIKTLFSRLTAFFISQELNESKQSLPTAPSCKHTNSQKTFSDTSQKLLFQLPNNHRKITETNQTENQDFSSVGDLNANFANYISNHAIPSRHQTEQCGILKTGLIVTLSMYYTG